MEQGAQAALAGSGSGSVRIRGNVLSNWARQPALASKVGSCAHRAPRSLCPACVTAWLCAARVCGCTLVQGASRMARHQQSWLAGAGYIAGLLTRGSEGMAASLAPCLLGYTATPTSLLPCSTTSTAAAPAVARSARSCATTA